MWVRASSRMMQPLIGGYHCTRFKSWSPVHPFAIWESCSLPAIDLTPTIEESNARLFVWMKTAPANGVYIDMVMSAGDSQDAGLFRSFALGRTYMDYTQAEKHYLHAYQGYTWHERIAMGAFPVKQYAR